MAANKIYHRLIYNLFRFLSIILVLNAMGVIIYGLIFLGDTWVGIIEHPPGGSHHPGADLLKGIDVILIGIVLLIFGVSIQSFMKKPSSDSDLESKALHRFFDVSTFGEQKHLLWQTFLTTLLFIFISHVFKEDVKGWELIIIPACTLLLAAALYLSSKSD